MPRRIRIELPDDIANEDYADIATRVVELLREVDPSDWYVRTDSKVTSDFMRRRGEESIWGQPDSDYWS